MKIELNTPVEAMGLSIRSTNCIKNADIKTIMELAQTTEDRLARTRCFGKKSMVEIKEKLRELGLHLGMSELELINAVPPLKVSSVNYDFMGDYRITPHEIKNTLLFTLYKRENENGQEAYKELVTFGIGVAKMLVDIFNEHISLYNAKNKSAQNDLL